jgi:hypothetical protein
MSAPPTLRLTALPLAVAHLLLAVTFVAGVLVVYTHREARDADVRRVGMGMMTVSAALIFVRLSVGEFMAAVVRR